LALLSNRPLREELVASVVYLHRERVSLVVSVFLQSVFLPAVLLPVELPVVVSPLLLVAPLSAESPAAVSLSAELPVVVSLSADLPVVVSLSADLPVAVLPPLLLHHLVAPSLTAAPVWERHSCCLQFDLTALALAAHHPIRRNGRDVVPEANQAFLRARIPITRKR